MPAAAYLFLRIVDVDAARRLMTRMLPQVVTAEPWTRAAGGGDERRVHGRRAVAARLAGRAGVLPAGVPGGDGGARRAPRRSRAVRARRTGCAASAPATRTRWSPSTPTTRRTLQAALAEVIGVDAGEQAVSLVHLQQAEALRRRARPLRLLRRHRAARGARAPASSPRPGDGQPDGAGGWRELATGEVLLGYTDEDGTPPAAPVAPVRPQRDVRRLPQAADGHGRVPALRRRAPATRAARGAGGEDRRPLGRRHAAVALPGAPGRVGAGPARINDFGYEDDPLGLKCPAGAHIRRTNPRDSIGFFDGRLSNRHRIVRRGRPYGPPLPQGVLEDDGGIAA